MKKSKIIIASVLIVIIMSMNLLTIPLYAKEENKSIKEENNVESNTISSEVLDIDDITKEDEDIKEDKKIVEDDENNNIDKEEVADKKEEKNLQEDKSDSKIEITNEVTNETNTTSEKKVSNEVTNSVNTNTVIQKNEVTNTINATNENSNTNTVKNEVTTNTVTNTVTNNTVNTNTNNAVNNVTNTNVTNTIQNDTKVSAFGTTSNPSISYSTHVQNVGWVYNKKNGERAGTTGSSLRLEALKINVSGMSNVNIKYQVHVQNIGWQGWKTNGALAGTEGQSLRLEAIKILLDSTEDYSVMYRVHVQNIGWQDWRTDGDIAGTEGQGLRLEAIEIKIVSKVKKGIIKIEKPLNAQKIYNRSNVVVSGWKMSNLSNTTIKAFIDNTQITNISYSKRNDIINTLNGYGTSKENSNPGFSFSIDTKKLSKGNHTVKILLYDKNNTYLKQESVTFYIDDNLHVLYSSHVQNIGWQGYKMDGELSGTEGMSYRVEALKIKLYNAPSNAKIRYRTHVQNIGWQNWKSNDELSGTQGQALRIEALQLRLENLNDYTIEYQVHIQNKGWSGWYIDGETAGTVGESLRIEAIRIRIVPKYKRRYLGIDVSRYNGSIDWNAVKNCGVDYVMIRVGYRGYAAEGNIALDPRFVENIEGAKKAGLKVGIYFFTQAITEQEAIEEANWVIDKIRPYKIDLPVAIDVEFSSESNQQGRADPLDKDSRTTITRRFCETIQNAGYIPMVYLNVDWAKNYVDMSRLKDFDTWIAHYRNDPNSSPNYSGSYTMWQYTSSGHINGISGDVDCNICYKKY